MIKSWIAFVIYTVVLSGTFVLSIFYNEAPFLAFATQFTIGFGAYLAKRLVQKKSNYHNGG